MSMQLVTYRLKRIAITLILLLALADFSQLPTATAAPAQIACQANQAATAASNSATFAPSGCAPLPCATNSTSGYTNGIWETRVVDRDGNPLANYQIFLYSTNGVQSTSTNANGEATISGISANIIYTFRVSGADGSCLGSPTQGSNLPIMIQLNSCGPGSQDIEPFSGLRVKITNL